MYIVYTSYARFNLEVKIERSGNKTFCQVREAHEKINRQKNVKCLLSYLSKRNLGLNELSYCHKLKFSNANIFAT